MHRGWNRSPIQSGRAGLRLRFLGDNSAWKESRLAKLPPEVRALWLRLFDPSQYRAGAPANSLRERHHRFRLPARQLPEIVSSGAGEVASCSIAINRPHGHIWTFPEVDAFVDGELRHEPRMVRVGAAKIEGGRLTVALDHADADAFKELSLCYTTNSGPWQKRAWFKTPASVPRAASSAPNCHSRARSSPILR